jgi:hypothetical protein
MSGMLVISTISRVSSNNYRYGVGSMAKQLESRDFVGMQVRSLGVLRANNALAVHTSSMCFRRSHNAVHFKPTICLSELCLTSIGCRAEMSDHHQQLLRRRYLDQLPSAESDDI